MAGQVVQIFINVTDGNASEAVQQVVAKLRAIGPAGEAAGAQAGAGLDHVGQHALTSLDNVRLLRDDFGIHLPRSMEKAIAQSALLSGAIGAIGPGLLAMGAFEIFEHIGTSVYKAYENFVELKEQISASEAVIKSFGTLAELAMNSANDAAERFIRITQGGKSADMFHLNLTENIPIKLPEYQSDDFKKLTDGIKGDFENITGESVMPKDLPATIEKLKEYNVEQEKALDKIRAAKSGAVLGGQYSVSQQRDMTMLEQRMGIGSGILGELQNAKTAYDAQVQAQQAQIDLDKPGTPEQQRQQQQAVEAEKSKQAAISALDKQAMEAQLSGIALIDAQQTVAEKDFVAAHGASAQAMADIDYIYDKKRLDLWDKDAKEAEQKNAKIADAQNTFNKEMAEVGTHVDDAQATGYARIADEAEKSAKRIDQAWRQLKDTPGISPQAVQDAQMLGIAQIGDVYKDSLNQMEQLHEKTMQQITKEEQQAARLGLPEWQQANLAIEETWQDRIKAITEAEDQQLAHVKGNAAATVMIQKDAAAQIAAANAEMNAQMQKQEEETRDKIANGLQSLFSNPEQFFEKRAMDTAFQLMANEMLSVFKSDSPAGGIMQYLFGMGPEMSTDPNFGHAMKSALGMGGGSSASGTVTPATMQFSQGASTLQLGSQTLMQAATSLQSAAGTMSFSGGGVGIGGGNTLGFPGGSGGGGGLLGGGGGGMDITTPDLSGTFDANGNFTSAASTTAGAGGMPGAMGVAGGIAGGALMAGSSILSAYNNSNPVSGAMGGAMGGMELGATLGSVIPGLGTVVGGAIGAIAGGLTGMFAGIFGDQGKGQAESLDVNTIQPQLSKDMQDYEAGRSGYGAIASDLNNMLVSAKSSTTQMGSGARNYFSSHIQAEINAAMASLQKQERGGRSAVTMSAAQYHTGGMIDDFGDLSTSSTEGFIHALRGEIMMNPVASATHAPILQAMNNGTTFGAVQPRMPAGSGGGGTVNVTVQAIDSKSVATWAKGGGGRMLVAAMNQAQGQYSGIGRG
ncbi:MAG: hypothetical protein WBQ94_18130 [Terracidiphilus sp.]